MSNFNVGVTVRDIGRDHDDMPEFYPEIGTIGTLVKEGGDTDWDIQWPKGSTSGEDCWYCNENDIELVENVDMANEEIWKMLESKIRKNGLISDIYSCTKPNGFYLKEAYASKDVHNAIAIAYRSGYERDMKGRPFKFGEKKKKGGHCEPDDIEVVLKVGYTVVDDCYACRVGDLGTFITVVE